LQATRAVHGRLRRNESGSLSVANGHDDHRRTKGDAGLTPRQLEILGYLADGLNTSQIAERLWLSRATVRNHVSGIFAALDCHSRLEAVAKARQLRLL
jgi:DNA-binding NarL/FixJ family response regulator